MNYRQIKDVYTTDLSTGVEQGTADFSLTYETADVEIGQVCTLTINGVKNFEIYPNPDGQVGTTPMRKIRWIYNGVMSEFGTVTDNTNVTLFSGYGLTENKNNEDFQNRTLNTFFKPGEEPLYVMLSDGTEKEYSDVAAIITHRQLLDPNYNIAGIFQKDQEDLQDPLLAREFKAVINSDGTADIIYGYVDTEGNPVMDADNEPVEVILNLKALPTPIPSVAYPDVSYTKSLTITYPEMDEAGFPVPGGTTVIIEANVTEVYNLLIAGNLSICLYSTDNNPVEINGEPISQEPYIVNETMKSLHPVVRGIAPKSIIHNRKPVMSPRAHMFSPKGRRA